MLNRRINFKKNWFWYASGLLIVLFVFSRFYLLGARPMHHDEGMLAYFADKLAFEEDYIYTPQIHGPILFYFTALFMKLFGSSDMIARLSCAICGIFLGSIPLFFRKDLGKKTAIIISLILLTSPTILYYSRFLVHTSIYILFNLLFILFIWRFFKKFKTVDVMLAAFFLALMFGTSETSYIFIVAMLSFVIPFVLIDRKKFLSKWRELVKFTKSNYLDLLSAVLVFVLTWLVLYSVGLTNLKSLEISIPNPFSTDTGLGFWLAQNPNRLGGQPWYFYIILAFSYEPMMILGYILATIYLIMHRKNTFMMYLFWWATVNFGIFSWAGEKFPWLFLPSLVALSVYIGYFLGQTWAGFRLISKIIWIVLLGLTIFVAVRLVYINPADTNELNVYVQTPASFEAEINKIIQECNGSSKDCVLINSSISWPLTWNFREFGRLDNLDREPLPGDSRVILTDKQIGFLDTSDAWTRRSVTLRDWWVPETCLNIKCVPKFVNYYFTRETWNAKGGYDIFIYERQ